jgi:DNA-binding transcriptional regulator YiaG
MSGREFRRLRKSIGYSQAMLSKELDVTVRGLSRWETGVTPIPRVAELALKYIVEKQQGKKGG